MGDYWKEIISAIGLVVVALIEAFAAKDRKKASEERRLILERSEIRAQESRLSMALMRSTCELSLETTKALRDGYTNGTLDGRMKKAEMALADYNDFLEKETARAVSK